MYEFKDDLCTYKIDAKTKQPQLLANFQAAITKETRYHDGKTTQTYLTLVGHTAGDEEPIPFEEITIPAEKFASMAWVTPMWGVAAVVQPGQSIKDDLRTAIQLSSKPERVTIYTHTGWTAINNEPTYLHAAGGISKRGNDPQITVELPQELSRYSIPASNRASVLAGTKATLQLIDVAPARISWPLLAATIRPILGPTDFAIHLSGRTGTFKSELTALYQCHFGCEMDARHLPGSWSSTANALERQAYQCKDAVFVVDDFIPIGTTYQVKTYQRTADQLIRGQGNQAGRARLTDTSQLQTTYYPRGCIISTGEDIPEGHSIRARMFILETTPGDIEPKFLSHGQRNREKYAHGFAGFIQWVARRKARVEKDLASLVRQYRDRHLEVGHSRTPQTIGNLMAAIQIYFDFAIDIGAMKQEHRNKEIRAAFDAIRQSANMQASYLTAADPCETFCETLRACFAGLNAHLRTPHGGIPNNPTIVGWTEEEAAGEMMTYKAHGKKIGWVDFSTDKLLVDAEVGFAHIKQQSKGGVSVTKQTMLKRLKESGHIVEIDEARSRNTIRVTCERHSRTVICMSAAHVLNQQEVK